MVQESPESVTQITLTLNEISVCDSCGLLLEVKPDDTGEMTKCQQIK